MRLENTDKIVPLKDLVVVDIQPRETSGLYLGGNEQASKGRIEMYYGIVEALGPQVDEPEHCPGLREGDTAIFSQFAGSHIATNDKKLHKIIRGYDIMATTTDLTNLADTEVHPTADRLTVLVIVQDTAEDGIVLSDEDARDPRLADISYGMIVEAGPSTTGSLGKNEIVAFDIHVGETIRDRTSSSKPELRVIREDDILFYKK